MPKALVATMARTFSRHERVLHGVAPLVVETGVVRGRGNARALEQHARCARPPCASTHRRRPARRSRAADGRARRPCPNPSCVGMHVVRQVRAIEAGDDRLRRIELELRDDVGANVRRRGRGERDGRRPAELFTHLGDAQIARAEVVAPLADAVRLVDGEQRDAGVAQPLGGGAEVEPLRRDVQQLDVAAHGARQAIRDLRRRERAVDERRRQAARVERVDLVLHQRDERRDDDRELGQHQRRHLVAERLAAARRQHDERVAAGEHGLDGRFLPRPERRIAEVLAAARRARRRWWAGAVELGLMSVTAWSEGARPRRTDVARRADNIAIVARSAHCFPPPTPLHGAREMPARELRPRPCDERVRRRGARPRRARRARRGSRARSPRTSSPGTLNTSVIAADAGAPEPRQKLRAVDRSRMQQPVAARRVRRHAERCSPAGSVSVTFVCFCTQRSRHVVGSRSNAADSTQCSIVMPSGRP